MQILAVPNWSFGRNREIQRAFDDALKRPGLSVHYCQGDVDHNRTVTAFSGGGLEVRACLLELCDIAFASIDLNRHTGVHPRIGALDVCPFVPLDGSLSDALAFAEEIANSTANLFELPIYLYEKSERGRHEADLPSLRAGGFGSLLDRELRPDFGPTQVHPRLGVSVMGVRDFLIALNVDLQSEDLAVAKQLAREIRGLRREGDPRFLGVRALGFPLASRGLTQVSMNLTMPDVTAVDPIVEWVKTQANNMGVAMAEAELVGVIRKRDMERASWLKVGPSQVIEA